VKKDLQGGRRIKDEGCQRKKDEGTIASRAIGVFLIEIYKINDEIGREIRGNGREWMENRRD